MNPDPLAALLDDPAPFLEDSDRAIRRLAVAACAGRLPDPLVRDAILDLAVSDAEPTVRAEAVEVLAGAGEAAVGTLLAATHDPDHRVVEAAATALGEVESRRGVEWLLGAAAGHDDRMVREAAVASLGAIGDDRAVPLLLDLLKAAPPQVRRRAVVALTAFDDPAIEPALRDATNDRNPMVREVAEMVVGDPSHYFGVQPGDGPSIDNEKATRWSGPTS